MTLALQIHANLAAGTALLNCARATYKALGADDSQQLKAMNLADYITPQHVRDYARFMADTFDLVYVTDEKNGLKSEIVRAVKLVRPDVDLETYLSQWAFTIDRLVWLPFSLEDPKPVPFASFGGQLITIAHEATHRLQSKGQTSPFAWDYITNEESRGQYEYEAYRVALEMTPVLYGGRQLDVATLTAPLEAYGLTPPTIAFVRQQLEIAKGIIARGGVIGPVSRVAIDWIKANIIPV